jgi:hypothetical protein
LAPADTARRVLRWLALRGSPPGRRLVPDMSIMNPCRCCAVPPLTRLPPDYPCNRMAAPATAKITSHMHRSIKRSRRAVRRCCSGSSCSGIGQDSEKVGRPLSPAPYPPDGLFAFRMCSGRGRPDTLKRRGGLSISAASRTERSRRRRSSSARTQATHRAKNSQHDLYHDLNFGVKILTFR